MDTIIYVDGGVSMKNKVGGCSAVIVKDSQILVELSEAYSGNHITNNTMELGGVILGLQYVLENPELGKEVIVISDSEYVVLGSERLNKWKLRGWKNTAGKVKNRELWEAVDYLKSVLDITFKWTKGHSSNTLNNLADELAVRAYTKLIKK